MLKEVEEVLDKKTKNIDERFWAFAVPVDE